MRSKTKKLTMAAMLGAMAYALVTLVQIPIVLFLRYEPKDVVITLGGFLLGPPYAFAISVIVSVLEMLTVSGTGLVGCLMNVVSTALFAGPAAILYRRRPSAKTAAIGLAVGWLSMAAGMMAWNWLITPLYLGYPREAVTELLLPAFLPFNLLKGGLNAAFSFLLLGALQPALRRLGMANEQKAEMRCRTAGMVAAGAAGVTCVLLLLTLRGVSQL